MARHSLLLRLASCATLAAAQSAATSDFKLALAEHKGQLEWSAEGFKVVQNSAKPYGEEIGIRGTDASGLHFLGFLFLVPDGAPQTSAKCRDGVLKQEMKGNRSLKIINTTEIAKHSGLSVALVTYHAPDQKGSLEYMVRGFIATQDLCGDVEFYSSKPINEQDPTIKRAFDTYDLSPDYSPGFSDVVTYAQILFSNHSYPGAAPFFEKALAMVPASGAPFPSAVVARRVLRDQAGMSYGIAGQTAKARSMIEKGIAEDPDYPLNYYNLACADAGESKLADAKIHLRQAFDRKGNVVPGESMPKPTQDDSFLPYRGDKEFWTFLEQLERAK